MKSKLKYIAAFALIGLIVFFSWLLTHQDNKSAETSVNDKITHIRSFHLSSDSTKLKTVASGTVFVKGNEGLIKDVQIIARIGINPADWGGVGKRAIRSFNVMLVECMLVVSTLGKVKSASF